MWQEIKHPDVAGIEKMVGEYNVELKKCPYKKIRIKIFLEAPSRYTSYPNMFPLDEMGEPAGTVGMGHTEEEALRDVIDLYLKTLSEKEEWKKTDFEHSDPFDF